MLLPKRSKMRGWVSATAIRLLLQTFDEYLNDFEKNRVGKDRKASTLENYRKQYRRLAAFLQYEYNEPGFIF